jgi:hypothetical protein
MDGGVVARQGSPATQRHRSGPRDRGQVGLPLRRLDRFSPVDVNHLSWSPMRWRAGW